MFSNLTGIIGSVGFLLVLAVLLYRSYREGASDRRIYQLLFFTGLAVGWLAFAALLAIPVKHLLIGLAASMTGFNLWRIAGMDQRSEFADQVMRWLPVAVPVLLIYPYWSMIIYFMGTDAVALAVTAVIVAGYTVMVAGKRADWQRPIAAVQTVAVIIMLLWVALHQYIVTV